MYCGLSGDMCFLHDAVVCPTPLHKKQMILSSVKNIRNNVWLLLMTKEPGSLFMSSCLISICRRKLRMCSKPSIFIPAFM